jgi:hypothetical protein
MKVILRATQILLIYVVGTSLASVSWLLLTIFKPSTFFVSQDYADLVAQIKLTQLGVSHMGGPIEIYVYQPYVYFQAFLSNFVGVITATKVYLSFIIIFSFISMFILCREFGLSISSSLIGAMFYCGNTFMLSESAISHYDIAFIALPLSIVFVKRLKTLNKKYALYLALILGLGNLYGPNGALNAAVVAIYCGLIILRAKQHKVHILKHAILALLGSVLVALVPISQSTYLITAVLDVRKLQVLNTDLLKNFSVAFDDLILNPLFLITGGWTPSLTATGGTGGNGDFFIPYSMILLSLMALADKNYRRRTVIIILMVLLILFLVSKPIAPDIFRALCSSLSLFCILRVPLRLLYLAFFALSFASAFGSESIVRRFHENMNKIRPMTALLLLVMPGFALLEVHTASTYVSQYSLSDPINVFDGLVVYSLPFGIRDPFPSASVRSFSYIGLGSDCYFMIWDSIESLVAHYQLYSYAKVLNLVPLFDFSLGDLTLLARSSVACLLGYYPNSGLDYVQLTPSSRSLVKELNYLYATGNVSAALQKAYENGFRSAIISSSLTKTVSCRVLYTLSEPSLVDLSTCGFNKMIYSKQTYDVRLYYINYSYGLVSNIIIYITCVLLVRKAVRSRKKEPVSKLFRPLA